MRAPRAVDVAILSRADGVEAEILQEKVATLRRLGGRLEQALRELRQHDRSGAVGAVEARERLVEAASEALWYFVVQREVCGLRDTERVLRELEVPDEVYLRMGVR